MAHPVLVLRFRVNWGLCVGGIDFFNHDDSFILVLSAHSQFRLDDYILIREPMQCHEKYVNSDGVLVVNFHFSVSCADFPFEWFCVSITDVYFPFSQVFLQFFVPIFLWCPRFVVQEDFGPSLTIDRLENIRLDGHFPVNHCIRNYDAYLDFRCFAALLMSADKTSV